MQLNPDERSVAVTPALWQQVTRVERVLAAMQQGQNLSAAIDACPPLERPAVQAIVYAVLRRYGLAHRLVTLLVSKKPTATTLNFLLIGLALAAPAEADETGAAANPLYDAHTLVNQVVEALRRKPNLAPQAGFVNACLRRFLREQPALMAQAANDPVAQYNAPAWWLARLKKDYPTQWMAIAQTGKIKAPLTLRVNRRTTTVADYLTTLQAHGMLAKQVGPDAVVLAQAVPVGRIPGFAQGEVSVQDAGAQWAVELLTRDWHPVGRPLILDACAAPGGKAAHLLERMDCELIALDIDEARSQRIKETLTRLHLEATVLCADASEPKQWATNALGSRRLDAIVLDAPCSASGIVRRHPDIPWQRRETDIDSLGQQQSKLLNRLWPLLQTGGRMLFCTCSVFKAEGDNRIAQFLAQQPDARLMAPTLQLLPDTQHVRQGDLDQMPLNHDGFFYALLEKSLG